MYLFLIGWAKPRRCSGSPSRPTQQSSSDSGGSGTGGAPRPDGAPPCCPQQDRRGRLPRRRLAERRLTGCKCRRKRRLTLVGVRSCPARRPREEGRSEQGNPPRPSSVVAGEDEASGYQERGPSRLPAFWRGALGLRGGYTRQALQTERPLTIEVLSSPRLFGAAISRNS